jgi:RimJ/RimL family protein N-acetyltransferase
MNAIRIVPTADEHVEGLNRCLDTVAREGRYLGLLQAPPVEASRVFVRGVLEAGGVSLVAVDEAGQVVGWCDVQRRPLEMFRHVGTLGIGMLPHVRGRGLGRRLMQAAIEAARERGMERIQLGVFASNTRAIALYESLGFVREGLKRRAARFEGRYDDDVMMALFLDEPPESAVG